MPEAVEGGDAAAMQYAENVAASLLGQHMLKVVQEIAQEIKKDDTA